METHEMKELGYFDQLRASITLFVDPCMTITVDSEKDCENALDAGRKVKSWAKQVEDKRKELVGPLNEQVKKINAYAKLISEPLEDAETHIKRQLNTWNLVLEDRRLTELKKLEEERLKKEAELKAQAEAKAEELAAMEIFGVTNETKKLHIIADVEAERDTKELEIDILRKTKEAEKMKVSGTRKNWTFAVTNLDLVPKEFFILCESKVREAIREGKRDIPGINVFQETIVAIR